MIFHSKSDNKQCHKIMLESSKCIYSIHVHLHIHWHSWCEIHNKNLCVWYLAYRTSAPNVFQQRTLYITIWRTPICSDVLKYETVPKFRKWKYQAKCKNGHYGHICIGHNIQCVPSHTKTSNYTQSEICYTVYTVTLMNVIIRISSYKN